MIYVHGVGPQDPPDVLRARLDRIVFGGSTDSTRLAYYAHVLHGERRVSALGRLRAAAPHRRPAEPALPDTGSPSEPDEIEALLAEASASDDDEATLMRRVRARLQRHEDATTADRPGWLEREAFRVLTSTLLPDVGEYFFGGHAEAMRQPLRVLLRETTGPVVIVSHSLGTVITYQVLHEPEFAGIVVPHWITVGSPLGIDEIRWLSTGGARPAPVPASVARWTNAADPLDPIALDATLADEYGPADIIDEIRVSIRARNHHSMAAYLAHEQVRDLVRASCGLVDDTGRARQAGARGQG